MNYAGWAMKPNEKENALAIRTRHKELKEKFGNRIEINKQPAYGFTRFDATVPADIADQVDEMDVLILADSGNVCFGGDCSTHADGKYSGKYFID